MQTKYGNYQEIVGKHINVEALIEKDMILIALELAEASASITKLIQDDVSSETSDDIKTAIGEILLSVTKVATYYGINLEDAAENSLNDK